MEGSERDECGRIVRSLVSHLPWSFLSSNSLLAVMWRLHSASRAALAASSTCRLHRASKVLHSLPTAGNGRIACIARSRAAFHSRASVAAADSKSSGAGTSKSTSDVDSKSAGKVDSTGGAGSTVQTSSSGPKVPKVWPQFEDNVDLHMSSMPFVSMEEFNEDDGRQWHTFSVDRSGLLGVHHQAEEPLADQSHKSKWTPMVDELRTQINVRGALSVADWMQQCLQNPQFGYYTSRKASSVIGGKSKEDAVSATAKIAAAASAGASTKIVTGGKLAPAPAKTEEERAKAAIAAAQAETGGDFITSPELGQIFGEVRQHQRCSFCFFCYFICL